MRANNYVQSGERLSFYKLFKENNFRVVIPIIQRDYAQGRSNNPKIEQIRKDFIDTLYTRVINENLTKDLDFIYGAVEDNKLILLDGQQRLTTLTILFCVLRDLGIANANDEQIDMLENSIQGLGRKKKQRLKLTTHSNNQALFEETIINGIDFSSSKKDIKNNRFLQTAYYFKNLILKLKDKKSEDYIENINEFVNYIFVKTTMIKVVCFDENFAIKLFSVLNDRGLNLTPADIIKAYLMESMVDDETKLNSFIEVWKQIEAIIDFTDEKMEGILNLYL